MAWSWLLGLLGFLQRYPEILVSIACFFFFFFFHQVNRRHRLPVNWPVIGMLPGLLSHVNRMHDWPTDLLEESGCTFKFKGPWFLGMDMLVTCDPANVNHIFNANFSNYPKGDEFSEIFDILGDGIFNSDLDSWKAQRKQAHSLMSTQRFRAFLAKCTRAKVEEGLIPLLNQIVDLDRSIDLQDVFLRFTFDNTCLLVFGIDPGCLSPGFPTVPFAKAMDDAEEVLFFRHTVPMIWWKLLRFLKIGEEKKLAKAWDTIDNFIGEQVSKRKEDLKIKIGSHENQNADLLTSYLDHQVIKGETCSSQYFNRFLRDMGVNFMLAGRDTTGAGLTWFFWLVSKNPNVETRILEELRSHRPQNEESCLDGQTIFEGEVLGKLVYLHAALCESLRLFPPVPFEHKGVLHPEILPNGQEVRRQVKIMFSLYAMGRMKGIWGEDCREFKPERWISEQGKLRHEPSYKFLSFNSGPRTCLGKDIAFTQMKAVAAAMIYDFHVQVVEGHVVEPKLSIILHMKNGLMAKVRKRSSS